MTLTHRIVFYSWQSDLPNKTNRTFIADALEKVVKAIRKDDSIEIKPVIDRDTEGVAGSPDISKTIFGKIRQSDIFLCDVSIIGSVLTRNNTPRAMPNPNVLVELGHALATLGDNRIIMVLNDDFGGPELLPFDLRPRRVISYHMAETQEPAIERKLLESKLTQALTNILKEIEASPVEEPHQTLAEQTKIAIEDARPNQTALIREYMIEVANKIQKMKPTYPYNEQDKWDGLFLKAIEQLTGMVLEFITLSETIAQVNSQDASIEMYEGFSRILDLYIPPPSTTVHNTLDYDIAKFFGHELFVTFFLCLIKKKRWEIIAKILDEDLYAQEENYHTPKVVPFYKLSKRIRMLEEVRRQNLKSNSPSLHADLLKERHTQGIIAQYVPIEQFIQADYFLFLRAQIQSETITSQRPLWMPWSSLHMTEVPRYLQEARRVKYAQQLAHSLGVENIETLRSRILERAGQLEKVWSQLWNDVIADFDLSTIGTL